MNGFRTVGGTREEAESVVRNPIGKDLRPGGKPRYLGFIAGELCASLSRSTNRR
jgi:hypothetical protein